MSLFSLLIRYIYSLQKSGKLPLPIARLSKGKFEQFPIVKKPKRNRFPCDPIKRGNTHESL